MALPGIGGLTEGGLTAAGTSLPVTLPSGGAAEDEYIVIIAKGSVSCTINALTGWTELLDEAVANGLAVLRYTGAGVPSNPTFVQSASSRSVWGAYRITTPDKAITPEIGVTATGTSTTPNPPARAVTGGPKDVVAICFFSAAGELADDDTLVTTFPSGSGAGIEKTGGISGTNLAGLLGAAGLVVSDTSSVDPGTFTQNASRAWRSNTIVIHGLVVPMSTSVARISLAPGSTPITRTGHYIKARARATGGAGTLRAALYEGAANRSGDLESTALTGSLAEYSLFIPDANAEDITDYSDLEIRFWGYSAVENAITVEIDQLWLEIPGADETPPPPDQANEFFAFI